ncbi:UDP-glucose dehydrogenase family protein [Roseibium sediminicola]|uniref:UDP-glucose 6-dehydrogenase n=1 Tax=Roseibium sediminicola TaxID=2933272 RepID=A0ABT0GWA7_9HYPH|nr:UDP-glucose/GDP-mannose dehydrogenase family protein [Roseibium sp. CAU 1639]MCK7613711.1 UDP-glucose/GDP-mannose dehydrogenase family protein [Roseibium sp. CAU 1639]
MNMYVGNLKTARNVDVFDFKLIEPKDAISVIGLGYVGAVSLACLSSLGHRVVGADIDARKVDAIACGQSPIVEDRLGDLLTEGVSSDLLSATTDVKRAVLETDITFVSVGTPTSEDGGCDTRAIEAVARSIGEALREKDDFHVVVLRCSVPPGTTLKVMLPEIERVSGKIAGTDFGICFNPEFLREGTAVADFHAPPKTVIGVTDPRTASIIAKLYAPVDAKPIVTTVEVAELVKYVDNVWHATKVCFGNEVGRLCKPLGIDSHEVMDIFIQDTKLNLSPYYLKPGFAFGGSCLPKEVRAVSHLAEQLGVDVPMIDALIPSNREQVEQAVRLVRTTFAKRVAILGVAFKPGTDDLRESPVLDLIAELMREGIEVTAYDPAIRPGPHIAQQFDYMRYAAPHLKAVVDVLPRILKATPEAAIAKADAIVVSQNQPAIRSALASRKKEAAVVDLVRMPATARASANYIGIGW